MAGLTEDMTRLRDEIEALRVARGLFIKDLKHEVSELKAGVADFLADSRKRHSGAGRETRRDLMDFTSLIKDQVVALKEDVAQMKADFFKGHMDMADDMKKRLHACISEIKEDVADLLSGCREHRREVSKETKERLVEDIFNIKEFIADLADNVSEMMSVFKRDHIDLARKGKNERKAFLSALADDVNDLQRQIAQLRNSFAGDITGAHRVWSGPSPIELKIQARRRAREEAKREKAAAREKHSAEMVPDDLTVIHGIGAGIQDRLNKGGIFTFARLAKSHPEEVRRIIGRTGGTAYIEKWIGQAKRLAGKDLRR